MLKIISFISGLKKIELHDALLIIVFIYFAGYVIGKFIYHLTH